MGKRLLLLLFGMVVVFCQSGVCRSNVIYNLHRGATLQDYTATSTMTFAMFYANSYWEPGPIASTVVNWDNINISENIGKTLLITSASDLEFDTFSTLLTNGIDDHFRYSIDDQVSGEYESVVFTNNPGGVDFYGFAISSVGLIINSVEVESLYPSKYRINYTYTFNGEPAVIPAPAALLLSCFGVGGFAWLRRKKAL